MIDRENTMSEKKTYRWPRLIAVMALAVIGLGVVLATAPASRLSSALSKYTSPVIHSEMPFSQTGTYTVFFPLILRLSCQELNVSVAQPNYLYRFDPNTQTWFTYTLPIGSLPSSVVATGTNPVHVWIAESGLNRIGHLIYTNTNNFAFIEYPIDSTCNSQPFRLALDGNNVWFTERSANRVGRLNALTGQVDEFYEHGLSTNAGLAGIDVAPDGSVYVAEQYQNRIARLVVTSTNDYTYSEYFGHLTGGGTMPNGIFGIDIETTGSPDSYNIHFTAPISNWIGVLRPAIPGVVIPNAQKPNAYPYAVVWDPNLGLAFYTEQSRDRVGLFFWGTTGQVIELSHAISRPSDLVVGQGNQLWLTQQDVLGKLARLVYTSTSDFAFTSYPLPTRRLIPTGVSAKNNGAVWVTAYMPTRVFLPIIFKS
jgi:streptogramin lyase